MSPLFAPRPAPRGVGFGPGYGEQIRVLNPWSGTPFSAPEVHGVMHPAAASSHGTVRRPHHQPFDWRLQMGRLGAALQDASPGSHGGRLDAMDARARDEARNEQQRAQLRAWAASAGLSPQDQALFNISPELFLSLHGRGYIDRGSAPEFE